MNSNARQIRCSCFTCAGLLAMVVALCGENGFDPIFDGRSLAGWETPDPSYCTMQDGAITARITKEPSNPKTAMR